MAKKQDKSGRNDKGKDKRPSFSWLVGDQDVDKTPPPLLDCDGRRCPEFCERNLSCPPESRI